MPETFTSPSVGRTNEVGGLQQVNIHDISVPCGDKTRTWNAKTWIISHTSFPRSSWTCLTQSILIEKVSIIHGNRTDSQQMLRECCRGGHISVFPFLTHFRSINGLRE